MRGAARGSNYLSFVIEGLGMELAKSDSTSDLRIEEAKWRWLPEALLNISVDLGDDCVNPMLLLAPWSMEVQAHGGNIGGNPTPDGGCAPGLRPQSLNLHVEGNRPVQRNVASSILI